MDTERWLPIPNWEGLYEVSDQGRVRSLDRVVSHAHSGRYTVLGKLLKQGKCGPYSRVALCRPGERCDMKVHRAVLLAFVGPCPEGREGCHRDGNPGNNTLENLYWGTRSENCLDQVRHGTHPEARRSHCERGHLLDEENTVWVPQKVPGKMKRKCLICRREWDRTHYDPVKRAERHQGSRIRA